LIVLGSDATRQVADRGSIDFAWAKNRCPGGGCHLQPADPACWNRTGPLSENARAGGEFNRLFSRRHEFFSHLRFVPVNTGNVQRDPPFRAGGVRVFGKRESRL
jgi:hypothetical protein